MHHLSGMALPDDPPPERGSRPEHAILPPEQRRGEVELRILLYERADGVALVTRNRPEVHNVLNNATGMAPASIRLRILR